MLYKKGIFLFYVVILGLILTQSVNAAGELWYTNKGLNAGTRAFEVFRDMFYDIQGANDVTEIAVRVDFDTNIDKLVAQEILVKRVGSDGYTPYPINVPGFVPDDVLKVLMVAFGGPDPGLLENYPVFLRKDAAYLPGTLQTTAKGDDDYVWTSEENPVEFKEIVRKLNARLNGGLSEDDINKSVKSIVMTTKGTGNTRSLVGLKVVLEDSSKKEPITFQGMDVYSILKDTYSAAVISRQLWQNFHQDTKALPVNDWPAGWSVSYIFRRVGDNSFTDRIVVYDDKDQIKHLYVNKGIDELERATGVNFNYIASKVIDIAGEKNVVEAKLTKKYLVDKLPADNVDRMQELSQNSFPLVSFSEMNVIAINSEGVEVGSWQGPYAVNMFGRFVENVSLWEKYFVLDSGYWKTQTKSSVPGPITLRQNVFLLGYDNISQSFAIKDHYLTFGTCLGQEEFNYPFVWAGSQSFYGKWRFAKSVQDVAKLVDEVSISLRTYVPISNEVINEVEQAIDNKYFYRDDTMNRRIAVNNISFNVSKTVVPSKSWGFDIPQVTNLVFNLPFQLPISYRSTRNIGGDNNISGAADFNNNYTYFAKYTGFGVDFNFDHDTIFEVGNHHLRKIGISLYKITEQRDNTIFDGVFYSPNESTGSTKIVFMDAGFGYPDRNTGIDKFTVYWRAGMGKNWSQLVTAQMKIAGPLWLDFKYALYKSNTFAYERVFMAGPVFKILY